MQGGEYGIDWSWEIGILLKNSHLFTSPAFFALDVTSPTAPEILGSERMGNACEILHQLMVDLMILWAFNNLVLDFLLQFWHERVFFSQIFRTSKMARKFTGKENSMHHMEKHQHFRWFTEAQIRTLKPASPNRLSQGQRAIPTTSHWQPYALF